MTSMENSINFFYSNLQVMVGQTIGALVFSVFAGQPLVVVMTTAPLALFISVIFKIASDFEIDFLAFYAAIGLWNSFFLCLYSIFNMSILMKFSSRYESHFLFTLSFMATSDTRMVGSKNTLNLVPF